MVTVRAPEIPEGLEWLNTTRPLTLRELRGHLVLLDFWTYCCVNCMHVIPVLRRIEERFAREPLVVIGVHSAKFDEEKSAARVMEAIARYDVHHPVVVDRDMQTWSAFAVRSWPTLVAIRPEGTIAAVAPGEPDPEVLMQFVEDELAAAKKKGTLAKARVAIEEPKHETHGVLSYPGKIAIAPDGKIAIADSGHHRVLVTDEGGKVIAAIGSGLAGHEDGAFERAAFDDPQGLAWKSATELFVADARAHTIAKIDLSTRRALTIAGTGELGASPLSGTSPAATTALRSPWDLLLDGDTLYVAMAGSHQIAAVDLRKKTIALVAGTGAESIVDGDFAESTFSQPSGLALYEGKLYVADSETSAVRELDLANKRVRTLVGRGLFDFGDRDGPRETALLQHCIGVAVGPRGELVVADTYNHKLRAVDRASGAVRTIAAGLSEPAGAAWDAARGAWLVADTNAHRIVRVTNDGAIEPLEVTGAPAPKRGRALKESTRVSSGAAEWFTAQVAARDGAALAPGAATIAFDVRAPAGKKLAAGSPIALTVEVSRRSDLLIVTKTDVRVEAKGGASEPIALEARVEALPADTIDSEIIVRADTVVCDLDADADGAVCMPHRAWMRLPIRLAKTGGARVELAPV